MNERRTGRTTRMIDHAIETAMGGKNVVVVMQNAMSASACTRETIERLRKAEVECTHYNDSSIQLHNGKILHSHSHVRIRDNTLRFVPSSCACFEWQRLSFLGSSDEVFIDHFVVECKRADIDNKIEDYRKKIAQLENEKAVLAAYEQRTREPIGSEN